LADAPIEHWNKYTGPANWFRLVYPPSWNVNEFDESVEFTSADGDVLRIQCSWLGDQRFTELISLANVEGLYPGSRRVQQRDTLDLTYPSLCLSGEVPRPRSMTKWRRLFSRTPWQKWRIWVMQWKSVCFVGSMLLVPDIDEQRLATVESILSSIRFAAEPADPPQVFSDRVLALARETFPLIVSESCPGFRMKFGESNISLFNFYRAYVNDPDAFRDIVLPALTSVVQVQEWGPDHTDPPLESVRDRIMPMIYPETTWREDFSGFCSTPWVAGLRILYVVDESRTYWYIHNDLLDAWEIDAEELHVMAIGNLERYFRDNPIEFTLSGREAGDRVLFPIGPDAYNSARLLSNEFHRMLRTMLGSELVVGVPSRDFFVAASLGGPHALAQIKERVAEDFSRMNHPITDRLLLVSLDGMSEYLPVMD